MIENKLIYKFTNIYIVDVDHNLIYFYSYLLYSNMILCAFNAFLVIL